MHLRDCSGGVKGKAKNREETLVLFPDRRDEHRHAGTARQRPSTRRFARLGQRDKHIHFKRALLCADVKTSSKLDISRLVSSIFLIRRSSPIDTGKPKCLYQQKHLQPALTTLPPINKKPRHTLCMHTPYFKYLQPQEIKASRAQAFGLLN